MNKFKKTDCLYTPLFCEENIWHLIKTLINKGINAKAIKVVFITNKHKRIAIFNQQSAEHNQPVIWDYHVILITNIEQSRYIFDFDTRQPFPDDIGNYFQNSFPDNIHSDYISHFRIIPADLYLKKFSSDRNHMKNIIPECNFPHYPVILSNENNAMYLTDLFDIDKKINHTVIFRSSKELINWVETQ